MYNNDHDRYTYQVERPAGAVRAAPEIKKKKNPVPALISLFLVFTLAVGGLGGLTGYYISQSGAGTEEPADIPNPPAVTVPEPVIQAPQKNDPPLASQAASPLDGALTIQEIFARGDKSTVAVSTTSAGTNVFGQPTSQAAAGSGFILTADGYVLTNHHVVEGASEVTVMLYDGTEYPAKIIGGDPVTDVAVLKIEADGLFPVRLGNSDNLVIGDQVVAIGNPLGELANSLSVGYVSAKKRIVYVENTTPRVMLQTDASVSPGNSGGPLFNAYGEVIGVVSAKTVASGVEGIGFAIPVNIAVDIANELIQNGAIGARPLLGVTGQDASTVENGKDLPKGVYVAETTSGGPADKAGIRPGDVITYFNGERITEFAELQIVLSECRVGDTVPVVVRRGGQDVTLSVSLDTEKPPEQPQEEQRPTFPWGR